MRLHPFLFLLLLLPSAAFTQKKFLQLEKANRVSTIKFYTGEELTFKIKGEKEWFTAAITDVQMDSQRVFLDLKPVRVADITAIRMHYPGLLRSLGPMLMVFGASWAGFSLVGAVFDDYKLTASTAIVSGTGLTSGFILHQIFKQKRITLNQRRRLRVVEIP